MRITIDDIIRDTDPFIRKKSKEVKLPLTKKDKQFLEAMYEYVYDSTDDELAETYNLRPAVGLAAVQAGKLKRMIAVVVPEEDDKMSAYALVNPKIVSHSVQRSYLANGEGCLSVDEVHEGIVPRYARITVKGYDLLSDQEVQFRARGYVAIVLQHEIDHLDGILYYDHIDHNLDPAQLQDAQVIE